MSRLAFKNENLLTEALTHKSYSIEENKNKPHNERLEFLGDSILNFVIAADLLKNFKKPLPLEPVDLKEVIEENLDHLKRHFTQKMIAHSHDFNGFLDTTMRFGRAVKSQLLRAIFQTIFTNFQRMISRHYQCRDIRHRPTARQQTMP